VVENHRKYLVQQAVTQFVGFVVMVEPGLNPPTVGRDSELAFQGAQAVPAVWRLACRKPARSVPGTPRVIPIDGSVGMRWCSGSEMNGYVGREGQRLQSLPKLTRYGHTAPVETVRREVRTTREL